MVMLQIFIANKVQKIHQAPRKMKLLVLLFKLIFWSHGTLGKGNINPLFLH